MILERTPYGITQPQGQHTTDPAHGWLPDPAQPLRGSILRGWKDITARGYACVYQDTRGRYASEGEDRVYCDDAADGCDTLDWDRGAALVQRPDRHGRLVRRRDHDPGRGQPGPSGAPGLLGAGRRLQHLQRRGLRGAVDRAGAALALGLEEHPGPLRKPQAPRHAAGRPGRGRHGGGAPARGGDLHQAGSGQPGRAAVRRECGLDAAAAHRLSGLFHLATVPERVDHPPGAGCVPERARLPQDDRHSGFSRHQLVRHLSDQRAGRLPGDPGPHRHAEALGSGRTTITSFTKPSSGRETRSSSGSATI